MMNGGEEMKNKRMTYYCMSKECDWEETSHKWRDGLKCPKCNSPVNSYYTDSKYK